ncbi:MAG: 30S ribosome-binding factor RbfA [Gammaproteobacteria bacterium]|nr:30S ribosome-binding factor RbfA [Gammaproteobacteria bacterium]
MPRDYPRTFRVNALLQRELALLIRDELADPRMAGVSVTAVEVSPDLRSARVAVSTLGDDTALAQAVEGLAHAAGRLRRALARRVRLRVLPQLHFVVDRTAREADRLNRLIRDAVAADAAAHGGDVTDDTG